MTVQELYDRLFDFRPEAQVYINLQVDEDQNELIPVTGIENDCDILVLKTMQSD